MSQQEFSARTRNENLTKMREREFDLIVIGGGVTGAAIARDATARGFKVALLEKGDFASGTSSRSSKLVHGGLRYLKHAKF
ncbi:MAG TPA: FAD-dependent oxidoreductase, partial [Candidatus Dormibacteraeota bacterium]|nr:FAD-dependent oxidoreductase [Candidatus Dormibacteraeota bacterium]